MMTKKPALLVSILLAFVSTGYCQYFPGARNVGANDIPGLIGQLQSSTAAQKKTDIMLSLGFAYLYKDGAAKADMDSAMYYAKKVASFSKQADQVDESLLLTAMIFMEQRGLAAAKRMLPALNDTTRIKLLLSLSKHCYYNEQKAPGDYSHLDSTVHYLHLAIQLASRLKHTSLQTASLLWLGSNAKNYRTLNLYENAENEYLFILKHYYPISSFTKIDVLTQLCVLAIKKSDFYQALNYAIQAEKELKESNTDLDHYLVYCNLGNIYKYLEKYDKGALYYSKVANDPARYASFSDVYIVANSYCVCLRFMGRNEETIPYMEKLQQKHPAKKDLDKSYYHLNLSNAYREMNMFEPAEENMLLAIKFLDLSKNPTAIFYSYLGTLYDKFNYPEKAIIALRTAEKKLTSENDLIKAGAFRSISKTEAALGNYEAAYTYLLKSKVITDSAYVASKDKHTQELEFQYQTQKKEADIRLKEENIRFLHQNAELMVQDAKLQKAKLNEADLLAGQKEASLLLKEKNIENLTNKAKLQQTEIAQAEAKRKITVLVITLLAVIIALLVWLFWSKLRSNRIITHKNGLLQQLVTDKSWLVKEMHHRVKNNLHTVMSLLESQSSYLQDDALEAVKNSQCRIFSMSLIHQKLYQDDIVKTIDMECYIPELISYLRECFNLPGSFRIHMDIDPAEFDVSEAVPLGLIVNEVVTNSLKYAHGEEIRISLKVTGINEYELTLADNGIGLREGFDIDNATSLGFKLIKGLSDQLDAQLSIINENGLKIKLSGVSVYNPAFGKQMTA